MKFPPSPHGNLILVIFTSKQNFASRLSSLVGTFLSCNPCYLANLSIVKVYVCNLFWNRFPFVECKWEKVLLVYEVIHVDFLFFLSLLLYRGHVAIVKSFIYKKHFYVLYLCITLMFFVSYIYLQIVLYIYVY